MQSTPQTNYPYGVPFRALFGHDVGNLSFLHAFLYTTYEDFPYVMPFRALFEHVNNFFPMLHVFSVAIPYLPFSGEVLICIVCD